MREHQARERARMLVQLRERQGTWLTQMELARRTGVNASHISRFERGERVPSVEILAKLAPAYGLTLTEVIEAVFEGKAPPPPVDPLQVFQQGLAAGPWTAAQQDLFMHLARYFLMENTKHDGGPDSA